MVQVLLDVFGPVWSYIIVLILTGIITSIIVEAVNLILMKSGKDIHPWWIVLAAGILIDILIVWAFAVLFSNLQEVALFMVLNFFWPILFYYMAGTFTVDLIFKKYKEKAQAVYETKINGSLGK